jgi:hypothetical protein
MHRIARFHHLPPPQGSTLLDPYPERVDLSAGIAPLMVDDDAGAPRIASTLDLVRRQFTQMPKEGTPASELTDRDRLALAIAAGVPTHFDMNGTMLTLHSSVPFGVADRPGGGYIVACARNASITTKEVL